MRNTIRSSVVAVLVFTVLLGLAYPLVVTGVAQVLFPGNSNGQLVHRDGKLVGSKLVGQDFRKQVLGADGKPKVDAEGNPVLVPDRRYFQSRPSQTSYNGAGTAFSNAGPNQVSTRDAFVANAQAYLALERRYVPGLRRSAIPPDAVMTSGSGIDPHISVDNARIQAHRVAAVRRLPLAQVDRLIDRETAGRGIALFGEPGVNVLKLNLALDKEATR